MNGGKTLRQREINLSPCLQLFRQRLSKKKKRKSLRDMLKGSLGNTQ